MEEREGSNGTHTQTHTNNFKDNKTQASHATHATIHKSTSRQRTGITHKTQEYTRARARTQYHTQQHTRTRNNTQEHEHDHAQDTRARKDTQGGRKFGVDG